MSVCNLSGSTSFTVAAKVLADEDLANEDDGPLEEEANDVEHREAAGKETVVHRTAAFRFNIARLWPSATATMRMNKTRPAWGSEDVLDVSLIGPGQILGTREAE